MVFPAHSLALSRRVAHLGNLQCSLRVNQLPNQHNRQGSPQGSLLGSLRVCHPDNHLDDLRANHQVGLRANQQIPRQTSPLVRQVVFRVLSRLENPQDSPLVRLFVNLLEFLHSNLPLCLAVNRPANRQ